MLALRFGGGGGAGSYAWGGNAACWTRPAEGGACGRALSGAISKVLVQRADGEPFVFSSRVSDLFAGDLKQAGRAPRPDTFLFVTSESVRKG